MKVNGKTFSNENAVFGPFIVKRGEDEFAFYAQPVWDYVDFDEICPRPQAAVTGWNPKTGEKQANPRSKAHKADLKEYGLKRWGYYILKALEPSKLDLSEHGVDLEDPDTYVHVEAALTYDRKTNPNGLGFYEMVELTSLIEEANCMDAEKLEQNKQSFLEKQASPDTSSACGKPVTDGE
jgi:hypothetical protein